MSGHFSLDGMEFAFPLPFLLSSEQFFEIRSFKLAEHLSLYTVFIHTYTLYSKTKSGLI